MNHGGGLSPLVFVSMELTVNVSASRALHYVRDADLRKTWDGTLSSMEIVESLGPEDDVALFKARSKQGIMEFALLRSWRSNVQNVEGRLLLSSLSVQHPACASPPGGSRRGVIGGSSGFLIDPIGENKCAVRYLLQVTTSGLELIMPDINGQKGVIFQSASRLATVSE